MVYQVTSDNNLDRHKLNWDEEWINFWVLCPIWSMHGSLLVVFMILVRQNYLTKNCNWLVRDDGFWFEGMLRVNIIYSCRKQIHAVSHGLQKNKTNNYNWLQHSIIIKSKLNSGKARVSHGVLKINLSLHVFDVFFLVYNGSSVVCVWTYNTWKLNWIKKINNNEEQRTTSGEYLFFLISVSLFSLCFFFPLCFRNENQKGNLCIQRRKAPVINRELFSN